MLNIHSAIRQMRIARRLGKLSLDAQNRLMRRLAPRPEVLAWENMMALRATIEKEIQPQLDAARQADDLLHNPAERRKVFTMMDACLEQAEFVFAKVKAPKLKGHEYTPAWWKEAEVRERSARKLANA
jgi:hypothetical protein